MPITFVAEGIVPVPVSVVTVNGIELADDSGAIVQTDGTSLILTET